MKKIIFILLLAIAITWLLVPTDSNAIPAFARKYGFNCNMCHTAFTKLNDFGQRYRDNGYQIPGQEGKEKTVLDIAPPISMRLTTGLSAYDSKEGSTTGFNLFGFDFLAAGVLHKNISFLLIYTPRIDEPAADYSGADNGTNPAQTAGLESVSLLFSNVIQDALNIRVGRFEPAYHAFSSKRTYYLFEPYEIYTLTTPSNSYVFDDNQIGIEATGHFRCGFKYGVGFVNGNGANPDNNKYKDVYANLSQTFGKGDGQSAGQRIGVFGYYGWQPTKLPGIVYAPTGETNGTDNKSFLRYGASGSFNWKTLNLQLLYMKGSDDKAFSRLEPARKYDYTGGFAQLDYAGLLNNRMVASVMYNWVRPPDYDTHMQVNAYSALLRYYLGSWTAVNVAIHAEFTHREIGKTDPSKDNLLALVLDFDF
jgi:hypothetical protein